MSVYALSSNAIFVHGHVTDYVITLNLICLIFYVKCYFHVVFHASLKLIKLFGSYNFFRSKRFWEDSYCLIIIHRGGGE